MTELHKVVSYRHEMKYLISIAEADILARRFSTVMERDPNTNESGHYMVRSLYFDDLNNTAYHEKMDGVPSRQKYRVRIYNEQAQRIMLERKLKEGSYVHKQNAPLSRDQVNRIMNGEFKFLLSTNKDLHKIFYYEAITRVLRPRVIVEYEREPFIYGPGDVRITFDKNVRAVTAKEDIFARELPSKLVLEPGKIIMEVKFTSFLPTMIRNMLPGRSTEFVAVSKYVACFDKITYKL